MVNKAGVGRLDVDRVGVRRCATDVVLSSWFGGGGVRRRVDVASSWRGGVLRRVEVLGVMRIDLVEVSSAFTGGTRVGVLRNLLAVVVVDRGGVLRNPTNNGSSHTRAARGVTTGWASDQQIAGSTPGRGAVLLSDSGQIAYATF